MLRRLAPLAAAGVVLVACGSGAADDATESTGPAVESTDAAPAAEPNRGSAVVPAEAPAALQFSAPLIGGGDIELTTLAGRPVLLWFWAPW